MMQRTSRFVLAAIAAVAVLLPPVAAAQPRAVALFNGKDLSGWSHFLVDPKVPAADVWSVRDGVLVCKGEPLGYLYTDREYTSFTLVVEWRWAPGAAARLGRAPNSGVLLRVNGEPKPKGVPRAYEAQLQAGNAGDLYGFWGMPLEGDAGRRREAKGHELLGDMVGFGKMEAAERPEGEWNTYEITLDGPTLAVVVNGKKVNEATGAHVMPGRIALQSEGGEIHFRRVELKPIGGQGTDPAAAILAKHKAADEEYLKAVLSPFTAVTVQYFQPGETNRLGVGPAGVAFGPSAEGVDVVELTLQDGACFVSPVAGAPVVVKTSGKGDVTGLPGTPVTARTRLQRGDVLRLGRHYVETITAPGSGNARVFDPVSPARKAFTGLKWFPPDPSLQVKARFVANPSPSAVTITTSRGLQREYYRVGVFEFSVEGKPLRLTALSTVAAPKTGEELFVAFRDATTGTETYDVGRYLFIPFAGGDATYVLDFNAATNPLCNYSPHYNCPIPLRENLLPVAIRAGEMKYPAHH